MYDLIIIGGGAASQSAAMYAHGKQLNFLLICEHLGGKVEPVASEGRDYQFGKMLVHYDKPDDAESDEQLIGSSVVHQFERQLKHLHDRILEDQVSGLGLEGSLFAVETKNSGVKQARAVIVATGARPRHLNLSGIADHLITNLGYNTTHHGDTLRGREVAVIGATDQALLSAAEFAQSAAKVYLVVPQLEATDRPELAALSSIQNVELLPGYRVADVKGEPLGRRLVLERDGTRRALTVDAIFVSLGYEPETALVQELVEQTSEGYIRVDRQNATSVPGLFAAGDVTGSEGEQVLTAIGDGARAARSAHFYVLTSLASRAVNTAP
ncbi:MAG: NAD(P)/FAD-dependent oxidoreductase [Oscillochloris sp.]|nr:NAD(P)/FAD-dependent oxidoreductase [Oscillochloris sp.]